MLFSKSKEFVGILSAVPNNNFGNTAISVMMLGSRRGDLINNALKN
jgi:hypothetical protein